MPPQVSVIIVNYNSGHFLTESVTAVLASTVTIDVWIVDNASHDTSLEMLRASYGQDSRLHLVALNTNIGFAAANNIALRQAQGEWLLLLNPDCIVQIDTLERMIAAITNYPDAGMAGCLICNPDGSEQAGCRRTLPTPWTGLARAIYLHHWLPPLKSLEQLDLVGSPLPPHPVFIEAISGAFMLLRRTALQQVGLLDEGYFLHCEDLDWCQTFRNADWKILFVPKVSVIHHKGACSDSRPLLVTWYKHRGMLRFYRKHLSRHYSVIFNLLVMFGISLRFICIMPIIFINYLRTNRTQPHIAVSPKLATSINELPLFPSLHLCRVLVTGGTGFIGQHLVTELLHQGAKVRIISRSPPTIKWEQNVEWIKGDLTDVQSINGICTNIEMVFHLASSAHLIDTVLKPIDPHLQVTVHGTAKLLQEAERANVKRLIFISSVKAMGEGGNKCLDETSTSLPTTDYGQAKLHAEQLVLETSERTNMHVTILRLPMVYGPGNKGNLPRMIQAIRKGTFPPLPQVHNRRSMVHVQDTVQAMLLAATDTQLSGRIYIVTDGEIYSTTDIERMIRHHLGKTLPRWVVPMWLLQVVAKLGDILYMRGINFPVTSETLQKLFGSACYSHALIQQKLGFKPQCTVQNSLAEMLTVLGSDVKKG